MTINKQTLLGSIFLVMGIILVSKAFYMDAKANLSQELIKLSWQFREKHQTPAKPWPWADTHVIAEIIIPRLNITQYIMQDSSGQSLAFGPGHLTQSAQLASNGHSMIAGHRDSHFDFIQHLQLGDIIHITHFNGNKSSYRISRSRMINVDIEQLVLFPELPILTLITCYPFDSQIPGGPLRWIVDAEQISS